MRQLRTFIAGPKCHAEFVVDDAGIQIVERTETGLGGFFADPPGMAGRAPDGGRLWSLEAVRREIAYALALQSDPAALRPRARWDEPGHLPAAAVRRLQVTTAEVAKTLPPIFRRPGTRYLEGTGSLFRRGTDPSVVAFDLGGETVEPLALQWYDRGTGEPLPVTTDPEDVDAVLLDTLDSRAIDWATKRPPAPVESVTVEPMRIRIVGAVSGVIDASLDGLADPGAYRPVYREADAAAMVRAEAARLGPREFKRRTDLSIGVAHRASTGERISSKNIGTALQALAKEVALRSCALEGCEKPVPSARGRYCSKRHRDRAYRLRRQLGPAEQSADVQNDPVDDTPDHPTCAHCDTVLLGVAAIRGTCSRHADGGIK